MIKMRKQKSKEVCFICENLSFGLMLDKMFPLKLLCLKGLSFKQSFDLIDLKGFRR